MTSLSIRDVACTRGYRDLFANLTLALQPGDLLRVEGPNGSGKTSLLRIIAGLAQPAEGEVLWNDQAIDALDSDYRGQLLYLGHKPAIKYELTPRENLVFAGRLTGFSETSDIEAALEQLGLYGFEDILCANLSAGQKRRVALSLLLLSRAKVWILDEPYTSLDVAAVAFLEQRFQQHLEDGGMLLLTSHQPVGRIGSHMRSLVLPELEIRQVDA